MAACLLTNCSFCMFWRGYSRQLPSCESLSTPGAEAGLFLLLLVLLRRRDSTGLLPVRPAARLLLRMLCLCRHLLLLRLPD